MKNHLMIGAAIDAKREGCRVGLEILLPLIFTDHEVDFITPIIMKVKRDICKIEEIADSAIYLQIGAMIETPRACLRADRIATSPFVDFLCFETNNLTQMFLGLSREDTQSFMV
jgi:pyruvate, orthophosphate dikinase